MNRFGIALIALHAFVQAASADEICGAVPNLSGSKSDTDSIKGDLQGKANFLSRLVGSGQLAGEINSTRQTIYQDTDAYFAAQKDAYLSYIFCSVVLKDDKISGPDKLKAINDYRAASAAKPQTAAQSPQISQAPKCDPSTIVFSSNHPDIDVNTDDGRHVGHLSAISTSVIQTCADPSNPSYRYEMNYHFYSGNGSQSPTDENIHIAFKGEGGTPLTSVDQPLKIDRCVYNAGENRNAKGDVGPSGSAVRQIEISVSHQGGKMGDC